ncbi:hypothetical protein H5410_034899 [Solanum commersonii]|uniref:Uncharacterized protein n=1 Tax=Solanum commersonii TaxID=4109 RepID=A0A9J5XZ82_SOLCO|nr:hypothetical protein H5410_034899 [Solanum commersonii]
MADNYALHGTKTRCLQDEGTMAEKQISGESGTRKQGPEIALTRVKVNFERSLMKLMIADDRNEH